MADFSRSSSKKTDHGIHVTPSLCSGRAGDGGLLEGHHGLHEHASVDGGAGDKLRRGGTKDDALEVRTSAVG
eukprot:CAMPEP_0179448062 /NCGR_PEP_ID=MMETSP0799-20121207/31856_1 /TAXON_ID=46947 /ORGANISM="Geminigera cryophila, Strain CCMP2564" /LENGTH=71 /DNA_ID=CAMNT_0021239425 /DNA_START=49 /DNA_END=261 /DNA_ORIENTATION=+